MKIQIPVDDLLKGQLHRPGWYKGKFVTAAEKLSKDGQSVNYEYSIKYSLDAEDKPVPERTIDGRFNSKAMGYMYPAIAAIAGMTLADFAAAAKKQGGTLTLEWADIALNKDIQFKIENKPRNDNGQLKSEITDWAPYGYKVPF